MALLDTGASGSCVDPSVIKDLKLEPRGIEEVVTPSTGSGYHVAIQHDLSIIIPPDSPGDEPLILNTLPVLALFAVGNVYVSLCKKSAYAPFSSRRRSPSAVLTVI